MPFHRFSDWLARAMAQPREVIPEPTAFALATVSAGGLPAVRMLLLKDASPAGFTFYTNLGSRKGRDLRETGLAALCFHWAPLELQVRVEGEVHPVPTEEADAYFASRERMSQIGAWASRQSEPLPRRELLDERVAEFSARFAEGRVPRPEHWSGFRLVPSSIEFWEGRPSRLHNRELYTRSADGWELTLLYP